MFQPHLSLAISIDDSGNPFRGNPVRCVKLLPAVAPTEHVQANWCETSSREQRTAYVLLSEHSLALNELLNMSLPTPSSCGGLSFVKLLHFVPHALAPSATSANRKSASKGAGRRPNAFILGVSTLSQMAKHLTNAHVSCCFRYCVATDLCCSDRSVADCCPSSLRKSSSSTPEEG